jgi:hypothetical protein
MLKRERVEYLLTILSFVSALVFVIFLLLNNNPFHEFKVLVFKERFLKKDLLMVSQTERSTNNTYVIDEVDDFLVYGKLLNNADTSIVYVLVYGVSEKSSIPIRDTIISKTDTLEYINILKSENSKIIYPANNSSYLLRKLVINFFGVLFFSIPFLFLPYIYINLYFTKKRKHEKNKAD